MIDAEKEYVFNDVISYLEEYYQLHSNTYKTTLLKNMQKIDENCFYVDQEYILYPIDHVRTMLYLDFPVYQYRVGNEEQSMSLKNMQKNRAMHERVIMSLMGFLNNENHSNNVESLLKSKIQKMSQAQIDTYISMSKSKNTKEELMTFLNNIKNNNEEIYHHIPGKKAACLRVLKRGGYNLICLAKKVGI